MQGLERRHPRARVCDVDHRRRYPHVGGFQAGEERGALLGLRDILGEPDVPVPGVHPLSRVCTSFGLLFVVVVCVSV